MAAMSDFTGYVASTLVLLTFMTKDMRLLRVVAILSNLAFISYGVLAWLPPLSNLAFISYGVLAWLPPVLGLHLLLLPINILRLREIITPRAAHRAKSSRIVAVISVLLQRSRASRRSIGRFALVRPN
jgi:hypothetical protein